MMRGNTAFSRGCARVESEVRTVVLSRFNARVQRVVHVAWNHLCERNQSTEWRGCTRPGLKVAFVTPKLVQPPLEKSGSTRKFNSHGMVVFIDHAFDSFRLTHHRK